MASLRQWLWGLVMGKSKSLPYGALKPSLYSLQATKLLKMNLPRPEPGLLKPALRRPGEKAPPLYPWNGAPWEAVVWRVSPRSRETRLLLVSEIPSMLKKGQMWKWNFKNGKIFLKFEHLQNMCVYICIYCHMYIFVYIHVGIIHVYNYAIHMTVSGCIKKFLQIALQTVWPINGPNI